MFILFIVYSVAYLTFSFSYFNGDYPSIDVSGYSISTMRAFLVFAFLVGGVWCLANRWKAGWLIAVIFIFLHLGKNLYSIYLNSYTEVQLTEGIFSYNNQAEKDGALFMREFGPIFMAAVQALILFRLLLSEKIKGQFGIKLLWWK